MILFLGSNRRFECPSQGRRHAERVRVDQRRSEVLRTAKHQLRFPGQQPERSRKIHPEVGGGEEQVGEVCEHASHDNVGQGRGAVQ